MTRAKSVTPSRPVSMEAQDDRLLPFAVDRLDLRGRLVRLGPTVDAILSHYDYPPLVARALGEAVALTALLGSVLESHGRFQLQTRSDGAIDMLVVDYDAPGQLRGFARFDLARVDSARSTAELLGRGHMALTIEREEDAARYQGVVALDGEGLAEAAHQYFRQSEQIPSFVRLAVAEVVTLQGTSWRAGGLLLQYLPSSGGRAPDLPPGDPPADMELPDFDEADAWTEGQALAATLQDHELVDPDLSGERLCTGSFTSEASKCLQNARWPSFAVALIRRSKISFAAFRRKNADIWSATTAALASPANSVARCAAMNRRNLTRVAQADRH